MAFIPRRRHEPFGLNLTPMIDVTFQLLIFFVCANTWGRVESAEKLDLPAPIQTAQADEPSERPRFVINLRPGGDIVIQGHPVSRQRLKEMLQADQQKYADRMDVVIRAHRDVEYGRTQEVFQICREAGIRQVRFAVLRKEG